MGARPIPHNARPEPRVHVELMRKLGPLHPEGVAGTKLPVVVCALSLKFTQLRFVAGYSL